MKSFQTVDTINTVLLISVFTVAVKSFQTVDTIYTVLLISVFMVVIVRMASSFIQIVDMINSLTAIYFNAVLMSLGMAILLIR